MAAAVSGHRGKAAPSPIPYRLRFTARGRNAPQSVSAAALKGSEDQGSTVFGPGHGSNVVSANREAQRSAVASCRT